MLLYLVSSLPSCMCMSIWLGLFIAGNHPVLSICRLPINTSTWCNLGEFPLTEKNNPFTFYKLSLKIWTCLAFAGVRNEINWLFNEKPILTNRLNELRIWPCIQKFFKPLIFVWHRNVLQILIFALKYLLLVWFGMIIYLQK